MSIAEDFAAEKFRALHRVEMAAGAAVDHGATPDEVLARVQDGIDAALADVARRQGYYPPPAEAAPAGPAKRRPALQALLDAVG